RECGGNPWESSPNRQQRSPRWRRPDRSCRGLPAPAAPSARRPRRACPRYRQGRVHAWTVTLFSLGIFHSPRLTHDGNLDLAWVIQLLFNRLGNISANANRIAIGGLG